MAPAKVFIWDPCPLGVPEILTAAHMCFPQKSPVQYYYYNTNTAGIGIGTNTNTNMNLIIGVNIHTITTLILR